MIRSSRRAATVDSTLQSVRAGVRNALSHLPGKRPSWIVVDLDGKITMRSLRARFAGIPLPPQLFARRGSLEELHELALSLAEAHWLEGVVFRIGGMRADPATCYGLRRVIATVRDSGKATVAYLNHLDWFGYYVATAAAEVVAPESADIALHGLGATSTYAGGALERLGVRFEKLAIGEYKTAFENLTDEEMSPAQREQLEALLSRLVEHFVDTVAERRGLDPARVREAIDSGITSAAEARDKKLLDRVAYEDELLGEKHKTLHDARRFLRVRTPSATGRRVGLVSLVGAIIPGRSRPSPMPLPPFGSGFAGAETVVRALRAAGDDPDTAAVVFFVDSSGGSAMASDLIWREVKRLAAKKPVVGVMGAVAASGGYYVLAPAARIIAAPTTITGSIGVFTGKLVVGELLRRHGLKVEVVRQGRFALLHHPSIPLGEEERALLRRANEEIYGRFVARVAEGRGLSTERVNEIGRGRVWAGVDALRVGLVDELGDVEVAIAAAKRLGELGADAPVWNVAPPHETLLPAMGGAGLAAEVVDWVEAMGRERGWAWCSVRVVV